VRVPSIVVAGCSWSSTPVPLLERLSVPAADVAGILQSFASGGREALLLSTCNRVELYALTGHAVSGQEMILEVLARRAEMTADELRPYAYWYAEADAVRHAATVASGLDSMILGEDQILSQWKRSVASAREVGAIGPVLDRMGTAALAAGKRVRALTEIGRHAVSLESLAVRALLEHLDAPATCRLVIVGAGESASIVVRQLVGSGVAANRITVASRSRERALALARESGAVAITLDQLPGALVLADGIICCASAPAVLDAPMLRGRPSRALVCVDLGLPRNVDDSVRQLPYVRSVALEELSVRAAEHRRERERHVPAARAIVDTSVATFMAWKETRGVGRSVGRLQSHAQGVAERELEQALARLPRLDPREREVVTAMARRIVARLMHTPSVRLRQHADGESLALAMEYAFGLSGADAELRARLPHEQEMAGADGADLHEDIA
jgi:glutamyl-tRNA reductase